MPKRGGDWLESEAGPGLIIILEADYKFVSEIAFQLGFGHSQSFSKLIKTRTNLSPLEFRTSFN
jgi:AraC-like DNA-binding protein